MSTKRPLTTVIIPSPAMSVMRCSTGCVAIINAPKSIIKTGMIQLRRLILLDKGAHPVRGGNDEDKKLATSALPVNFRWLRTWPTKHHEKGRSALTQS